MCDTSDNGHGQCRHLLDLLISAKIGLDILYLLSPKCTTVLLVCYGMGTVHVAQIWRTVFDKDGTLPVFRTHC